MIKILFICHGNICRSPMAEYVLRHLAAQRGLAGQVEAHSAATSTEEIGNGVHWGTRQKLRQMGVPCGGHRAVQMTRADYARYDLLLGMDSANIRNMLRLLAPAGDPDGKVRRLLDWSARPRDIADPWYTGDFDATYADVLEGCTALLDALFPAR